MRGIHWYDWFMACLDEKDVDGEPPWVVIRGAVVSHTWFEVSL
jgi:hypothetical protein